MQIELHKIKIRDIRDGYSTVDESNKVFTTIKATKENGLSKDGELNIRPPYQREFVYNGSKRDEVIRTILKGFPLNVLYWVKNEDGTYEILDGQQRTISILDYIKVDRSGTPVPVFSLDEIYFHSQSPEKQKAILDYELMVYVCEGTYDEKLEWFKVINISGEKLADQELRNAMFTGKWLYEAKKHFSRRECVAVKKGKDYVSGDPIRQDLLELIISWCVYADKKKYTSIEKYMSDHHKKEDANDLWSYYQEIIDWVKRTFIETRKEMKGLPWGEFFYDYMKNKYNPNELEKRIQELILDDEVGNKKGIYEYLLSGNEKSLSLRAFTESQKSQGYEACKGICAKCGKHFEIEQMEADHIDPWSKGGKTDMKNLQMLCAPCNRRKSDK